MSELQAATLEQKPRLRGRLHQVAFFASIPQGVAIVASAAGVASRIGAAIYAGSDAMGQLWAFIVFPLVGAALGVLVWVVVHDTGLEDAWLRHA